METSAQSATVADTKIDIIGLIAWLAICLAASLSGSYFTGLSVETWYPALKKPAWTPGGAFIGTV